MTNLLIVGNGGLGKAISSFDWGEQKRIFWASNDTDLKEHYLDITNEDKIRHFLSKNPEIDIIVNTAAMTDVDGCEESPDAARDINALAVRNLAQICNEFNIGLLHVSTDFVFDGLHDNDFYGESDDVNPRSVYGQTKLEGEYYALDLAKIAVVVRTAWLFGGDKKDLIHSVVEKAKKNEDITIGYEQTSCPTHVDDLARAIINICDKMMQKKECSEEYKEIYHVTNAGKTNRLLMAKYIVNKLSSQSSVKGISTDSIEAWKAVRPVDSALSNNKYEKAFDNKLRCWEEALDEVILKIT